MNQISQPDPDTSDLVTTDLSGGVFTITLGNGRAHPLCAAMIQALHRAVNAANGDENARVIVLHGPGHIFCAGHDLKEIARHRDAPDQGESYLRNLFDACAALMQAIGNASKPTIAQVGGIATAAGLQMVAACDLAYASDTATFCLPGVLNGGFCTTPAVTVSRAVGRKHLMELLLTGTPKDAAWAMRAGLINDVLPAADLAAHVATLAQTLATRNPGPIAAGKACTFAHLETDLATAYARAGETMIDHFMDPERIAHEKTSRWKAD